MVFFTSLSNKWKQVHKFSKWIVKAAGTHLWIYFTIFEWVIYWTYFDLATYILRRCIKQASFFSFSYYFHLLYSQYYPPCASPVSLLGFMRLRIKMSLLSFELILVDRILICPIVSPREKMLILFHSYDNFLS